MLITPDDNVWKQSLGGESAFCIQGEVMDPAGDILLNIARKAFLVGMKEARDDGEDLTVASGQRLQNPMDFELIVPDKKLPVVYQCTGDIGSIGSHKFSVIGLKQVLLLLNQL